MKILVLTVAGTSSRFGESLGKPCLKCIYHRGDFEQTLLSRMLRRNVSFDRYIIVGGYRFDELQAALREHFSDWKDRISLIYNPEYSRFGTGYSLYLGLQEALKYPFDELIFAEGDLFVDDETFRTLYDLPRSAVTFTREEITAKKSVVFYYDQMAHVHYLYDTSHGSLEIKEPFTAIYNSGQIWKFADRAHVKRAFDELNNWEGTNLAFIQKYFGGLEQGEYERIGFRVWINCNTVEDFNKSL